ncbi:MAG: hypothetical protein ACREL4_01450, partial [Gemmatimonadales bacterium]
SSYYSGVSNIYRYDFDRQVMEPLSNAETGFFKPVPVSADSLVVFQYTARGFVPAMIPNAVQAKVSAIRFLGNEIAEQRPEVQTWMPPPSSQIDLDSIATDSGSYSWLHNFKLDNLYPIVEGYEDAEGKNGVAGGLRFNLSDRVGTTSLDVTSSYSPTQDTAAERLHLRAVFRHWNWRISASLNRADFYDLFGPTKVGYRGYSLAAQYRGNLLLDAPRDLSYTLRVAGYGGLQTLPQYQGVASPSNSLVEYSANLAYQSLRRSLGAVADELGTTWALTAQGNQVNGSLFPRINLDASKGVLLPLDHSSLWVRASAGTALAGDRADPNARFFFGGFGNNWVDDRDIQQFRAVESFPGVGINTLSGASYGRAQVELTSPPLHFRQVGIPTFYLNWASLSLFATGLVTDVDHPGLRTSIGNVGAQADLRLVTLSHLESTLSLGYAVAAGKGVPRHDQWM